MKKERVRKAFTLAEVLITLAIIGVVAAMTLPSLMANKERKELQASLAKNYSVISQALVKMSYDEGIIINFAAYPHTSNDKAFFPYFIKYFDVIQNCNFADCINGSKEEGDSNIGNDVVIGNYRTYNKSQQIKTAYFYDGQFVLKDGSLLMIENPNNAMGFLLITVDVNGYKKRPNIWGQDLFTFEIMDDGKFLPMGADGTKFNDNDVYCSKTSSGKLNGIGCTYMALTDKDYWKKLP